MTEVAATQPDAVTTTSTAEPTPEPTPKSPATKDDAVAGKPPTEAEKRAWKIKLDGKIEERHLSDDEVQTLIQKGLGAEKRFEEAHALRTQGQQDITDAKSLLEYIKSDPKAALSDPRLGVNVRQFAEEFLTAELEKEMMDPKERELMDARAERDRLIAENQEREEKTRAEKEASEKSARAAKMKDALATKINAILKDSILPQNDRTVAKIAYYMQQAIYKDMPVDIEDIRAQVEKDYQSDFGHVMKDASPQQIVSIIGETKLKELRQWDNERITGKKAKPKEKGPLARAKKQMRRKIKTPDEDNMERFGTLYPHADD